MQGIYPELNRWKGIRAAIEGLPLGPDVKDTTQGAHDNFLAGQEAALAGRKASGKESKIVFFMLGYRYVSRIKSRVLTGAPRAAASADSPEFVDLANWTLALLDERFEDAENPPANLPEPARTVWRNKMLEAIDRDGICDAYLEMLAPVRDGARGDLPS